MKLIAVALVCLLVAEMWLQDVDSKSMHVSSSNCCFEVVTNVIPANIIRCYRSCSSSCTHKDAVIFKLKRGKESCASKTEQWVKDILKRTKPCPPNKK